MVEVRRFPMALIAIGSAVTDALVLGARNGRPAPARPYASTTMSFAEHIGGGPGPSWSRPRLARLIQPRTRVRADCTQE
jgi:hypothetical protein